MRCPLLALDTSVRLSARLGRRGGAPRRQGAVGAQGRARRGHADRRQVGGPRTRRPPPLSRWLESAGNDK